MGSKCIRSDKYKYVYYANKKEEFFDLIEDSNEHVNIIAKKNDIVDKMKKTLMSEIDINFFGPGEFILKEDEDIILDRLKRLGYL